MLKNIRQISDVEWELPIGSVPGMRVPGRFFLSEELFATLEEGALTQLANIATLPGIVRYALAMPDIHWGYGFPIGGVGAFTVDEGIISPGGVGFDINCGVRLLTTPLTLADLGKKKDLIQGLFSTVPTGVGTRAKKSVSQHDLDGLMEQGAAWVVEDGRGLPGDLDRCEDFGCMKEASVEHVSEKARKRGLPQCGTLGAGNHFLEIQTVDKVYDETAAKAFGLVPDQICVMIHCGSRGLGHQICTDHLRVLEGASKRYQIDLPDRQLACAPITSPEGEAYFGAMAAAATYAWANRQIIKHLTREVLAGMFGIAYEEMPLVYDVTHNVAKREEHVIGGIRQELVVHRKGATRAFGPETPGLPPGLNAIGQPVLIPGSMGTPSYVLKGTTGAMEKTFGSTCHGAGRVLSRSTAKKEGNGAKIRADLAKKGIYVKATSNMVIAEEAPEAYKSSSAVVDVVHRAGIAEKVVRIHPVGVIKG